jgi:hypothetical protein
MAHNHINQFLKLPTEQLVWCSKLRELFDQKDAILSKTTHLQALNFEAEEVNKMNAEEWSQILLLLHENVRSLRSSAMHLSDVIAVIF